MVNGVLRRIACTGAIIGLGIASSPRAQAEAAARVAAAPVASSNAAAAAATATRAPAEEIGRGWGAMIGCASCLLGAGIVIAGGPAAILIAVNTPGSSIAVLGCIATCYEAVQ
jgi:tartrate dehydratase alpha subunit/fumarate hydratase class I-like protein